MFMKELILYSDGGVVNNGNKDPNKPCYGSYCGIIVNKSYKEQKIFTGVKEDATNNQMELTGVMVGMEYIAKYMRTKFPSEQLNLTVISDSQYLIKGCNEWLPNWKRKGWRDCNRKIIKNLEMWKDIDKLLANKQINYNMKWVRGHSGKTVTLESNPDGYFNERCDTILTEGLKEYR